MARIDIIAAGQTLGAGVVPYCSVWLNTTIWELWTSLSASSPTGIYEGDNIVVTDTSPA